MEDLRYTAATTIHMIVNQLYYFYDRGNGKVSRHRLIRCSELGMPKHISVWATHDMATTVTAYGATPEENTELERAGCNTVPRRP